ncbi:PQQ-binding-like beta-propeller repeat protein [Alienimonas chondri]|uniref:Pyrrolo-quinoline quinone repeat domain-containing protein n=1 Tax=Alienimonas chondri TaxID=2681879 RepID=A0ABX1VIC2_9PLAN|nr:PQQ-binding-like beta-propeller repeat protein [Alienimonas chondri]NNJ27260.1 hypothetical protein [Alienimonas chondri]
MIRPRFAPSALLLSLLGLTLSAPVAAHGGDDWSQWRGPNRTGAAMLAEGAELRTDAPPEGLKPVWTAELDGDLRGGWSSPVVADGRVYLAVAGRVKKEGVELPPAQYPPLTEEEEAALPAAEAEEYERNRRAESLERRRTAFTGRESITCYDAATGETLWTNDRDTPVTRFPQSSTPAAFRLTEIRPPEAAEKLLHLSGDRVLRLLSATTGETEWEITLPGEFDAEQISSSPLVTPSLNAGGDAYIQAGSLFCVELRDGSIRWDNQDVTGRDSSPAFAVVGDEAAVIVNSGGETVAVSPRDGSELFRLEETGASRSSPIVSGDRLLTYGDSRKGGLRCYDLTPGSPNDGPPELLWKYQKLSDPGATPVVAGDLVLVPGDRRLDCVSLKDGAGLWTARLDLAKPRYTSPAALVTTGANGETGGVGLYTYGRLLAFDLTGEEFRPRFDLSVGPGAVAKTEDQWREELNLPVGDAESVARFDKEVTRVGLLPCASPAIADGRIYVRLEKHLACYDLTK